MPSTAAERAADTGILYAKVVIRMVRSKVRIPAMWPFILLKDNAQNKKKMGKDTTIAVRPRLLPTAE
jgi:hypothetical protein